MKRTIATLFAVAAVAAPAAHADGSGPVWRLIEQERAQGHHISLVGVAPPATDPVAKILAQEQARRLDPRLYSAPPPIEIVQSSGFHWSDAGIGAAIAAGLMLLALGTTLVVRSTRVRSA